MYTDTRKTERKIVSISSKRQITIPQKFFKEIGFEDEAECVLRDGELVLRPAKTVAGGDFAEQILAELIKEGYSGQKLLDEFKERQARVRPAVEQLLEQARQAADGKGEYETYEDVFGAEE